MSVSQAIQPQESAGDLGTALEELISRAVQEEVIRQVAEHLPRIEQRLREDLLAESDEDRIGVEEVYKILMAKESPGYQSAWKTLSRKIADGILPKATSRGHKGRRLWRRGDVRAALRQSEGRP